MKSLVIVLYMIAAPGEGPVEVAVIWGEGADAACNAMAAEMKLAAKAVAPPPVFWCAPLPSDASAAPSRSLHPKPRPKRS